MPSFIFYGKKNLSQPLAEGMNRVCFGDYLDVMFVSQNFLDL
jgi:hypothetical protein